MQSVGFFLVGLVGQKMTVAITNPVYLYSLPKCQWAWAKKTTLEPEAFKLSHREKDYDDEEKPSRLNYKLRRQVLRRGPKFRNGVDPI